jgi:hypothetical protein
VELFAPGRPAATYAQLDGHPGAPKPEEPKKTQGVALTIHATDVQIHPESRKLFAPMRD